MLSVHLSPYNSPGFSLCVGQQSQSSGSGGSQSSSGSSGSSSLPSNLSYTSYILKQTPQVTIHCYTLLKKESLPNQNHDTLTLIFNILDIHIVQIPVIQSNLAPHTLMQHNLSEWLLGYVDNGTINDTIDLSRAHFWLASQGPLGNRDQVDMWHQVLALVLSKPFGSHQDKRQPYWLRWVALRLKHIIIL